MWVRTQEDELVNLGNIEYVRVEYDDESQVFELRAYAFGWEPEEDEDEFYPLASSDDDARIAEAMNRLTEALQRGDTVLDFRAEPPGGSPA
jgi:hypothetical protein